jgi:hypothetical protein
MGLAGTSVPVFVCNGLICAENGKCVALNQHLKSLLKY